MWGVWRNYLWYIIHVFSLPQLMRSWVSPFKRVTEGRGNTLSFEDFASYIIINILSRLVGAIVRTAVIFAGLVSLLVTVLVGFVLYAVWMVLPFVIIGLVGAGLSLLFISI